MGWPISSPWSCFSGSTASTAHPACPGANTLMHTWGHAHKTPKITVADSLLPRVTPLTLLPLIMWPRFMRPVCQDMWPVCEHWLTPGLMWVLDPLLPLFQLWIWVRWDADDYNVSTGERRHHRRRHSNVQLLRLWQRRLSGASAATRGTGAGACGKQTLPLRPARSLQERWGDKHLTDF